MPNAGALCPGIGEKDTPSAHESSPLSDMLISLIATAAFVVAVAGSEYTVASVGFWVGPMRSYPATAVIRLVSGTMETTPNLLAVHPAPCTYLNVCISSVDVRLKVYRCVLGNASGRFS